MSKIVLDVGQCNPDHSSISQLLKNNFSVTVQRANSMSQALQMASETKFDLILINRILDADGTSGMEVLRAIKSNHQTAVVPVMLVSNYAEAQAAAIAAGAVEGFGKSSLTNPATLTKLADFL